MTIHIGYAILGMLVAAFLGFLLASLLAMAGRGSDEERIELQLVDLRKRLVQECDSAKYWIDNYKRLHKDYKLLRDGGCGKSCEAGDGGCPCQEVEP
ncbi:hypothetical protein KKE60_04495 [Patescibacteria group bacterium]|nr:hypothetical protein [Patescibacteria group bacterium]